MKRDSFSRAKHAALLALVGLVCLAPAAQALAHFPWLALDDEQRVIYFFGENVADRTYHLPAPIAAAKVFYVVDGQKQGLELTPVESDAFVGRRSQAKIAEQGQVQSSVVYGNYHGMKLSYYTQLVPAADPAHWPQKPAGQMPLEAVLEKNAAGVTAKILWEGEPLAGAKVQLFCHEGDEEATATTDGQGIVRFPASEVEAGLNGLLVGHVDKQRAGELAGKPYQGEAHYLTVTFVNK